MEQQDIVVYGASGYTGKLIAESLHRRAIPFTAAGRSGEKIAAALEVVAARAGVRRIDAKVVAVSHDVAALTELFRTARVVVNVTGPFMQMGETVVRAALAADCHYVDTTGEQDFMLAMRSAYGEAFAAKQRLLAPACSYMWTIGALAAEVVLENKMVDSLELVYVSAQGAPSIASSQSFMRMLAAPHYFLREGELHPWALGRTWDVMVPGHATLYKGSSWGGAGEPAWFLGDPRVRNCTVYNCADDNARMEMVAAGVRQILEKSQGNAQAREAIAMAVASSLVQQEPPKEDPAIHRGTVHCNGSGSRTRIACTLNFHSPYVMTGELIAHSCQQLLRGSPRVTGFASLGRAFGHRSVLEMLIERDFLQVIEG